MDLFLLIGFYILMLVVLPIGLACLFYFVPKKLGFPNTGKFLALIFGILALTLVLWTLFEDQLFTKNNAMKLVEEQELRLTDEFILLENKSMSAPGGDYYHTFTLDISEHDKQNIISKIKSSKNFKSDISLIDKTNFFSMNRYFGPKLNHDYETEIAFVREYFQPSGQMGYAPTFRRISISKTFNKLTFEDINE